MGFDTFYHQLPGAATGLSLPVGDQLIKSWLK